jgi:hypothetical protein
LAVWELPPNYLRLLHALAATNRLHFPKAKGVLVNYPKLGYWLPDEPLTPVMEAAALTVAETRRKRRPVQHLGRYNPNRRPGARIKATPALLAIARKRIAAGEPAKYVARDLGVSYPTLFRHLGGPAHVREAETGEPQARTSTTFILSGMVGQPVSKILRAEVFYSERAALMKAAEIFDRYGSHANLEIRSKGAKLRDASWMHEWNASGRPLPSEDQDGLS